MIVNTLAKGHGGAERWLGILTPDPGAGNELRFFDSHGFPPDGTNAIMGVTTHFSEWCKRSSELAGQGGRCRSNNTEIECEASAACGNLSACFILHGLPARPDGSITPPWTQTNMVVDSIFARLTRKRRRAKQLGALGLALRKAREIYTIP